MKSIGIDAYIVDTLMPDLVGHDKQTSAFLLYLFLFSRTQALGAGEIEISLRSLSEGTGLSRRAVQDAVTRLSDRRLIEVERETITAVSRYRVLRPWIRSGNRT